MTDKIEFFDQIELYLHIPFCVKKCAYCDFLSFPAGREEQSAYVEALLDEINKSLERGRATTIFFGGGTPSLLPGEEISRIMDAIRKKYEISADAEITLEANPGTITLEKLRAWKGAGINRLSMGLQSTENEELRNLGRIHTCEVFLQGYEMARTAGFENINIDLMSSLPGQSPESWRRTLKRVVDLEPEHISAYSLIIEEGTPFYDLYEEDVLRRERGETSILLPTEEEERQMYYDTKEILETYGYHRYEISNYAKTGYECRHNCGYWKRVNYRGYGLGASSLLDNVRFKNTSDLQKYLNREFHREEEEILTDREQMAEFMFLGLRLMEGISRQEFEETFGRPYDAVYGIVSEKLEKKGLLQRAGDRIFLTEQGIDVSNYVMAEFL